MRFFAQQIVLATLTLFLTTLIFNGLQINGGIVSYLFSAVLLVLGFIFLKPIISAITLPIAALTFNLITIVTTLIIVYLISLMNPQFDIVPFAFSGLSVFGYIIPAFQADVLLSYVIISVTIHIIYKLFIFLFDI